MLQRNDQGHVVDVMVEPTDDHPDLQPFTAGPGEVKDHPYPLGGWTPLDPIDDAAAAAQVDGAAAPASPAEDDATAPAAKPTRTRNKSAANAAEGSDS